MSLVYIEMCSATVMFNKLLPVLVPSGYGGEAEFESAERYEAFGESL